MFRTIKWYFKFVFCLVFVSGKLNAAQRMKRDNPNADDFIFNLTSNWAKGRIIDSGAQITVYGQENIPESNCLFVSNHQSDFDIAIFMAEIPKKTGFIAKIELKKVPLIRNWMELINCIFIDRNDLKQSMKAILEGIQILKQGKSLVVFPEGTRSKCDKVGEFKPGSFKLATKAGVPIVPVTIDGSYKIFEGSKYTIRPEKVSVYIHQPIETCNLSKEEQNQLPKLVRDIIVEPIASKQEV